MHLRSLFGAMLLLGLTAAQPARADDRKPPPPASQLPPSRLNLWLDGIHLRDGHPGEQADIHHFCAAPKTGPIQCTLWNGFGEDAKLVGVEYIVDAKTFATLPQAEKRLWHSHVYEATSGALVLPGMSEEEETKFLEGAISTYGKTWHTWDEMMGASVPMGRPELMLAFTRDGQLRPEVAQGRDRRLGTDTAQLKARRAKAFKELPKIDPNADVGEGGQSCLGPRAAEARPGRK